MRSIVQHSTGFSPSSQPRCVLSPGSVNPNLAARLFDTNLEKFTHWINKRYQIHLDSDPIQIQILNTNIGLSSYERWTFRALDRAFYICLVYDLHLFSIIHYSLANRRQ
jgi:hypothetical protein